MNELSKPFNVIYNLLPFYYFFNSKLCLIFFFEKLFNNFSNIVDFYYIRPPHSIFSFFNHKTFFRPIWSVTFSKNVLHFDIFKWLTTSNLGSLSLFSIYVLDFTSTGFILTVLRYALLYSLTKSSIVSIYIFLILKSYISRFYSPRFW